jgi:hypothetical protein
VTSKHGQKKSTLKQFYSIWGHLEKENFNKIYKNLKKSGLA